MRNYGDIDVAEGKDTADAASNGTCYLRCLRASRMMSRAIQIPSKKATM